MSKILINNLEKNENTLIHVAMKSCIEIS